MRRHTPGSWLWPNQSTRGAVMGLTVPSHHGSLLCHRSQGLTPILTTTLCKERACESPMVGQTCSSRDSLTEESTAHTAHISLFSQKKRGGEDRFLIDDVIGCQSQQHSLFKSSSSSQRQDFTYWNTIKKACCNDNSVMRT